jgi:hypothetical protein
MAVAAEAGTRRAANASPPAAKARILTPFRLAVGFVLAVVALLHGNPVPHQNEFVYLLRLEALADPSFLRGDWTYRGPFHEHLVFNTLLAPVTRVVPIEVLGWVGRLGCWTVLTVLVLAIARRLGARPWPAAAALVVWIACQPRLVGGDWLFGTFEAKPIAYALLFGAVLAALRGSVPVALLAAGLVCSLHPGVGIWTVPPLVLAMMLDPVVGTAARRQWWIAGVAALPGVWGIVSGLGETDAPRSVWTFVVDRALPFHLDPFYFGMAAFVALWSMFACNLWYCRRAASPPSIRLLGRFQLLLALPMVAGVLAYLGGADEYLKYLPFRTFPVLTTLLFALLVAREWSRRDVLTPMRRDVGARSLVVLAAATIVVTLVASNPVKESAFAVRANYREWTRPDTDLQRAMRWIAASTPSDAVVILPPSAPDSFHLARRPQIANLKAISYEDVAQWRERVVALLGPDPGDGPLIPDDDRLEAGYDRITPATIGRLQRDYGAEYLVSRGDYDLEVVHREGPYAVYRLPVAS